MKVRKYTPFYVQVDYDALSATLIYGNSKFHRVTREEKEDDINWIKETYGNNDVFFVRQISQDCEIEENSIREI